MSDSNRDEWVRRVLGVDPGTGAATGAAASSGASADVPPAPPPPPAARAAGAAAARTGPRPKLMPIWNDAKEKVDAGIERLQAELRTHDDEDLNQIAEFGLFGATTGETVKLMAALRTADGGDEAALERVRDAVEAYRDFLDGAPIVELIEDNPFGVKVPLRRTLGDALDEIERLAA